jgi:hypothetical protein
MVAVTAGWKKAKRTGSHKVSDAKLAKDIAASIKGTPKLAQ